MSFSTHPSPNHLLDPGARLIDMVTLAPLQQTLFWHSHVFVVYHIAIS